MHPTNPDRFLSQESHYGHTRRATTGTPGPCAAHKTALFVMHPVFSLRHGDAPFRVLGLQEVEVGLPLVADDLAAGEAANGNDHLS